MCYKMPVAKYKEQNKIQLYSIKFSYMMKKKKNVTNHLPIAIKKYSLGIHYDKYTCISIAHVPTSSPHLTMSLFFFHFLFITQMKKPMYVRQGHRNAFRQQAEE